MSQRFFYLLVTLTSSISFCAGMGQQPTLTHIPYEVVRIILDYAFPGDSRALNYFVRLYGVNAPLAHKIVKSYIARTGKHPYNPQAIERITKLFSTAKRGGVHLKADIEKALKLYQAQHPAITAIYHKQLAQAYELINNLPELSLRYWQPYVDTSVPDNANVKFIGDHFCGSYEDTQALRTRLEELKYYLQECMRVLEDKQALTKTFHSVKEAGVITAFLAGISLNIMAQLLQAQNIDASYLQTLGYQAASYHSAYRAFEALNRLHCHPHPRRLEYFTTQFTLFMTLFLVVHFTLSPSTTSTLQEPFASMFWAAVVSISICGEYWALAAKRSRAYTFCPFSLLNPHIPLSYPALIDHLTEVLSSINELINRFDQIIKIEYEV